MAAKHKHHDLIPYLADLGADYEKKDDMNRSPITYTLMNNGRECFLEFLKIGAEPWEIHT